jgi:hypothetical protein
MRHFQDEEVDDDDDDDEEDDDDDDAADRARGGADVASYAAQG